MFLDEPSEQSSSPLSFFVLLSVNNILLVCYSVFFCSSVYYYRFTPLALVQMKTAYLPVRWGKDVR